MMLGCPLNYGNVLICTMELCMVLMDCWSCQVVMAALDGSPLEFSFPDQRQVMVPKAGMLARMILCGCRLYTLNMWRPLGPLILYDHRPACLWLYIISFASVENDSVIFLHDWWSLIGGLWLEICDWEFVKWRRHLCIALPVPQCCVRECGEEYMLSAWKMW